MAKTIVRLKSPEPGPEPLIALPAQAGKIELKPTREPHTFSISGSVLAPGYGAGSYPVHLLTRRQKNGHMVIGLEIHLKKDQDCFTGDKVSPKSWRSLKNVK